jgi:hypothetical protein
MGGIFMALTYAQLSAIAQNTIEKTLTDNVYSATPVLKRFTDKAKKIGGGMQIQVPVISSKPTGGGSYADLDTLTITRSDNMSAAVYDWKQYFEPVRVSRLDLAKTSGDAAKLDLIASKIKIAESNFAENLSVGLQGDGTGNSGKDLTGFGAMIAASGTYGGIAPADLASWAAVVKANGGTDRALTLALIQSLIGACSNGKDVPTLLMAQQKVYDEAYALFTPFQRIESEEMGKLGFKSLMINGIPLVVDSHVAAKTLVAVNEDYANLYIHKDNNMRKEHHASLETTDSMLTKIFWMGNLGCSQRRAHGKLTDIIVAA